MPGIQWQEKRTQTRGPRIYKIQNVGGAVRTTIVGHDLVILERLNFPKSKVCIGSCRYEYYSVFVPQLEGDLLIYLVS